MNEKEHLISITSSHGDVLGQALLHGFELLHLVDEQPQLQDRLGPVPLLLLCLRGLDLLVQDGAEGVEVLVAELFDTQ